MARTAPRKRGAKGGAKRQGDESPHAIHDHLEEEHVDAVDALVHEAHIDPAEAHLHSDVPPPTFRRFDPRRITHPAPLFPLVVLFGLNAVDELDRTAFAVLLPNIRDWFGLNLTTLGIIV